MQPKRAPKLRPPAIATSDAYQQYVNILENQRKNEQMEKEKKKNERIAKRKLKENEILQKKAIKRLKQMK